MSRAATVATLPGIGKGLQLHSQDPPNPTAPVTWSTHLEVSSQESPSTQVKPPWGHVGFTS